LALHWEIVLELEVDFVTIFDCGLIYVDWRLIVFLVLTLNPVLASLAIVKYCGGIYGSTVLLT
jgi:hypothetical protein